MSDHRQSQRPGCEPFASILAALDFDKSETPVTAAARAHLAGCLDCQADQRAYARLDSALRASYGAATEAPFATSDLLAAIGATSEPQPRRAASPIRSVRYLKDFDDSEERTTMTETDERAPDGAAPATMLATQPGLRPLRSASLRRHITTIGFSATAVAVVLIVAAVSIFGPHLRPNGAGSRPGHSSTTLPPSLSATGAAGIIALSMDSATDGWALGGATLSPTEAQTAVGFAFYRYDGHTWGLTQRLAGLAAVGMQPARIQAFSPTNAWAYADGAILHYDGTSWRPAPINITSGEHLVQMEGFQMTSPTEGWAAAYLTEGTAGPGAVGFLHYTDGAWALEQEIFAPATLDLRSVVFSGFAASPGNVVWAVGWASDIQQSGRQPTTVGLIFHRVNWSNNDVNWNPFRQLGSPDTGQEITLLGVGGVGPHALFTIGQVSQGNMETRPSAQIWTYGSATSADAPDWNTVHLPLTAQNTGQYFNQIQANNDHDIWIAGSSGSATDYPTGFESHALLLHYDGSSWTEVKPTVDVGKVGMGYITAIGLAPNGDLWAGGFFKSLTTAPSPDEPMIWRYSGGVWSAETVAIK